VILDSARGGEYSIAEPYPILDSKVAAWLLETAVTAAPDGVRDFESLVNGPCLFPFKIGRTTPEQLAASGRLEVSRQGLEATILRVRKTATPGRQGPNAATKI
jgi:hypothetical protein